MVTDQNGATATASVDITVIKVVFISFEAIPNGKLASFYGLYAIPGDPRNYRLGGAAKHHGVVQVQPKEARPYVNIQLFQTLNSDISVPVWDLSEQNVGNDDAYNDAPAASAYQNQGEDQLVIEYGDFPCINRNQQFWKCTAAVPSLEATMSQNFYVFLRYQVNGTIVGGPEWATVGELQWGLHGGVVVQYDPSDGKTGGTDITILANGGTGTPSTEAPHPPDSPN